MNVDGLRLNLQQRERMKKKTNRKKESTRELQIVDIDFVRCIVRVSGKKGFHLTVDGISFFRVQRKRVRKLNGNNEIKSFEESRKRQNFNDCDDTQWKWKDEKTVANYSIWPALSPAPVL